MPEQKKYTGWVKWTPTQEEWNNFFTNHSIPFPLTENEYLIMYDSEGVPTYYCYEDGKLRQLRGGSIKTYKDETDDSLENSVQPLKQKKGSKGKDKYSKGKQTVITPRNDEQVCAFDLIKDNTKTVKLIEGRFGSGKTMILVCAALEALRLGKFERIIWLRNNVRTKDTPDLGALPGTTEEKLFPFLGPFRDHCGEAAVKTMLNKGTLCVEPLQSLRGRNFVNTLILCSEAENLTTSHIQLIIARAAEGSQVWFDGDRNQFDSQVFEKCQGLKSLVDNLKGNSLFGYVYLTKSERSNTATLADLLDNAVLNEKTKN